MRYRRFHRRSLAPLALALGVWLVWPAQAFAKALMRFIHGTPGVGATALTIDGQPMGTLAFGQATRWHSIRSGSFTWKMSQGAKVVAGGTARVGRGAYDVVLLETKGKIWCALYRARAGRAGTALVRVIHSAPELGSPALSVDGKQVVSHLGYAAATPYLQMTPGSHTLSAMRPGDSTPLVSAAVRVQPGHAYSAVVLGTRGQVVRVVTLTDRGAPLTRPAHGGSSGAPGRPAAGTIVVHSGDCLWDIARGMLGSSASNEAVAQKVRAIWNANAGRIGTGDPNLIFPGTRLRLP